MKEKSVTYRFLPNCIKKIMVVCLTLVILATSVSCNAAEESATKENRIVERECDYFETIPILPDLLSSGNSTVTCVDAATQSGNTAILLNSSNPESGESTESSVIYMSDDAQSSQALSLRDDIADFFATACTFLPDGRLAVLGYSPVAGNKMQIITADGSVVEKIVDLSGVTDNLIDVLPQGDHWFFLSYDSIIETNAEGQTILQQPIEGELVGYDLFLYKDKPSVWIDESEKIQILSLNKENKSCEKISAEDCLSRDIFLTFEKNGQYFIDSMGVYLVDPEAKCRVEIASWNSIDIPPSTSVYTMPKNIVMDENTILQVVRSVVPGRSDELNLLIHRDIDPNANKETLTIGGYGVGQGDLLKYAVYLYNTGDYKYRIKLVDYYDKYMFEDNESMRRANLNIIKDMSEGKGDDMLTGIFFDFATLGRAGTVLDILTYAEKDTSFQLDSILPSIVDLLKTDEKLYQIAPSFTITGFVGYSDSLENAKPLTIESANQIVQNLGEGQYLVTNSFRINLAILAVQYRLQDYLTEAGDFDITTEEISSILSFADSVGMADDLSGQPPINDANAAYVTEKLLLLDAFINSPYAYNQYEQIGNQPMTFFGIPSLSDSARVCAPRDLLAISAASEDPEACWEFIKLLFSLEAQRRAMLEDCIPVATVAFEEQIAKAMKPSLMTPDDAIAAMQSQAPKPMSAETADRYRECVNSLNAINCYNIEIGNILWEEFNSYYYDGKPIQDVRDTVVNRINMYLDEK